jgi:hypothetical protein
MSKECQLLQALAWQGMQFFNLNEYNERHGMKTLEHGPVDSRPSPALDDANGSDACERLSVIGFILTFEL